MAKEVTRNPRYVAYARVNGRSCDQQLAHDRERWPGGLMTGFTLWIQKNARAWKDKTGHVDTMFFPDEFTEYLRAADGDRVCEDCGAELFVEGEEPEHDSTCPQYVDPNAPEGYYDDERGK